MGRTHQKPSARSENNSFGCMKGLINMLNFSSNPKFLTDTDNGHSRHLGSPYLRSQSATMRASEIKPEKFIVAKHMEAKHVISGATTILKLMEEEMSRDPKVVRMPDARPDDYLEKNHKQRHKNLKLTSDQRANESTTVVNKSSQSDSEKQRCDLDVAALVQEINNHYKEKQLDLDSKINLPTLKINHHYDTDSRLTKKHSTLQKSLSDIIEASQNKKPRDAEFQIGNNKFQPSKELVEALESPYFDSELFQKIVQELQGHEARKFSAIDSHKNAEGSMLLGGSNGKSGKSDMLVRSKSSHIRSAFFWKKNKVPKLLQRSASDSSLSMNKIVVLKPNQSKNKKKLQLISPDSSPSFQREESTESIASSYSYNEINKRLHHAIGESRKEQLMIANDGALHKVSHGSKDSEDMVKMSAEMNIQTGLQSESLRTADYVAFPSSRKSKNEAEQKECQLEQEYRTDTSEDHTDNNLEMTYNPLFRKSVSHKKTMRHLPEMLNTGGDSEALPAEQIMSSLGELIGYTYVSPKSEPGRGWDNESSDDMSYSPIVQFKQEMPTKHLNTWMQDIVSPTYTYIDQDGFLGSPDSESRKGLITKGNVDIKCMEERDLSAVCSESESNEDAFASETCKEENDTSFLSSSAPSEDRSQVATLSSSISHGPVFSRKLNLPEIRMENPANPSPLSVLEPFMFEDVCSPGSSSFEHAEHLLQPKQLHFEERETSRVVASMPASEMNIRNCIENKAGKLVYVKTWLEVSGISSYSKLSKRLHLSSQLLDPSLCDEAQMLCDDSPDELILLFDCTNEVLVEMWEKYYSCTPWLSVIKAEVRLGTVGGNLIQDVHNDVEQRLRWHFPFILDHTIKRDLDYETWNNYRCETESCVFEIGEDILDVLIEETLIELGI